MVTQVFYFYVISIIRSLMSISSCFLCFVRYMYPIKLCTTILPLSVFQTFYRISRLGFDFAPIKQNKTNKVNHFYLKITEGGNKTVVWHRLYQQRPYRINPFKIWSAWAVNSRMIIKSCPPKTVSHQPNEACSHFLPTFQKSFFRSPLHTVS